jgi:hypothetical protein
LGDNGQLVLLQLVGPEETSKKETKAAAKKRSRRRAKKAVEVNDAEATEVEETAETEEITKTEEIPENEDSTKDAGEEIVVSDKQAGQDEK